MLNNPFKFNQLNGKGSEQKFFAHPDKNFRFSGLICLHFGFTHLPLFQSDMDNNDFQASELNRIAEFIHRKNTAVVTTMFTDIKGFTEITERKGDEYSHSLRQAHDNLLKEIIEADDKGVIVKFIGDAVMAIFSEPSTAVLRAVEIQKRIREFNKKNSEFEDLSIRIGLHMGQVAVEDKIQTDVFGRHVNRASRVEGLADGGQIFITYPVFDSAKGWMESTPNLQWTLHGSFYLKGIEEATEIYEVVDSTFAKPRPPRKGKKKRAFPKALTSVLIFVFGLAAMWGYLHWQFTEVWLVRFYPEHLYVNGSKRLLLEGNKEDEFRKVAIDLPKGKHILHFDTSAYSRHFAEIEIKSGDNFIEPEYTRVNLPSVNVRVSPKDNSYTQVVSEQYSLYDANGNKIPMNANLQLETLSSYLEDQTVQHQIKYKIIMNGQLVHEGEIIDTKDPKNISMKRQKAIKVWEDDYQQFEIRYYLTREYADITLEGVFKTYPHNE